MRALLRNVINTVHFAVLYLNSYLIGFDSCVCGVLWRQPLDGDGSVRGFVDHHVGGSRRMLARELKLSASEFLRLNFHGLTTLCGNVLTIGLDTDAVPANTKYKINQPIPKGN